MGFLLLSILSSTSITLVFKLITRRKIDILSCIVVNYLTAGLLGFVSAKFFGGLFFTPKLIGFALIVGLLFILTFYLIGKSIQKAGMGVTTISSKMSVAIPITISFLFDKSDTFSLQKIAVLTSAILAVILSTYKKERSAHARWAIVLPILLFFCMGITDSSIKLSQLFAVSSVETLSFSSVVFAVSATLGVLLTLANKDFTNFRVKETWIFGVILGVANLCSLLFFLLALNSSMPSSLIFGINNVAIVIIAVLIGAAVFKEKLSMLNMLGVATSVASLTYLSLL